MQEWKREEIELDDADGEYVDVMLRYMYDINWLETSQRSRTTKLGSNSTSSPMSTSPH